MKTIHSRNEEEIQIIMERIERENVAPGLELNMYF